MAQTVIPDDLNGLHVIRLAKLAAVDMTTAATFNVYNNGNRTILLIAWVAHNFSAFPNGTAPPATWAFSYGTDSTTAPVNMKAAGTLGTNPIPVVVGQSLSTSTTLPYITPGRSLYLAVTTTTNGVGTVDFTFYGGILGK